MGRLLMGQIPDELKETATQIKFLDPASNNGHIVFEADQANDKLPAGSFLYINKNTDLDYVWVSSSPGDATSDRFFEFDIGSGVLIPKGEKESHFAIEPIYWEYTTVIKYYRDPEGGKRWTTARLLVAEV